ncbi:1-phosphofructokinase [Coprococcus sp. AF21-14LB]|uniref:1-phosphofructokinase n=1 Tax=Coprococcus sp. AF21-14LB TaxID=2292231 RepID=UPI000E521ACC|nr:1-phosphofructokinase [Coprococcus sp. AF21-14LB]RGS82675.1 1-phosphofructokinase [Coprococcus sp. AF21-14LB]
MIYTVTFNPSLDYIVTVDVLKTGEVNRTSSELILPGGKGINVSIVLKHLGMDNTALGFISGFTGEEIRRRVKEQGVEEDFIELKNGWSRINMKIRSAEESEINGQGPVIDANAVGQLCEKLEHLSEGDVLVLAGSIPNTMPDTIYRDILESLEGRGIQIVVDATKDLLVNVLKYRPFLIKPNHHELAEIFQTTFQNREEIIRHAKKLQEMGARNVLISMAGDGAVLVSETGAVYESEAPKGVVVNSVGAGDSMVAGFLAGYLQTGNYKEAFKMGIASGSASAFSENLATLEEVEALKSTLCF